MNERILKIARQVWPDPNTSHVNHMKFAELIVKECAGRVDHILRERQAGGGTMGDDIREHFGVEE
jgi:hypothetical protein